MRLNMIVRDSRMFGPTFEVRREMRCVLGQPTIAITDQVTNRGDTTVPHHWLYHINLGYPLLDAGARFVYRGKAEYWELPEPPATPPTDTALSRMKLVSPPLKEHAGAGERGMVVEVEPDRRGMAHVGLINRKLKLGVEIAYTAGNLPRVANWQHYGPRGSYVSGIEPFHGSLLGLEDDPFPQANTFLKPGQTEAYELTITVHADRAGLESLAAHDGDVFA